MLYHYTYKFMRQGLLWSVADLVVDVAVSEHCVKVLDTLLGIPVVIVLQALLYRAHVHRNLDDLIVVLGGEGE